jgi:hypothetical protein
LLYCACFTHTSKQQGDLRATDEKKPFTDRKGK